jgi:hypothetical protein
VRSGRAAPPRRQAVGKIHDGQAGDTPSSDASQRRKAGMPLAGAVAELVGTVHLMINDTDVAIRHLCARIRRSGGVAAVVPADRIAVNVVPEGMAYPLILIQVRAQRSLPVEAGWRRTELVMRIRLVSKGVDESIYRKARRSMDRALHRSIGRATDGSGVVRVGRHSEASIYVIGDGECTVHRGGDYTVTVTAPVRCEVGGQC